MKAQTRLHKCAGLPEPSLVGNVIPKSRVLAMSAASQLPGGGLTDVDDYPVPAG